MFRMCDENVESDCSIDCSSPMSASTVSKMAMELPSSAGMCRPHSAISVKSPMVFSVTVLPPVFGPVMTMVSKSTPRLSEMGTTFFASMSGWRARLSSSLPSVRMTGSMPCIANDSFARAKMQSSVTSIS